MNIRRFQDINLKNKRVLLRVDFNVTMKDGNIEDDTRIVQTLPTIKHLIKSGAKTIIVSHLGRPKGKDKSLSLNPIAKHLSKLIKKPVFKLDDCIGATVKKAVKEMKSGEIIMLENIRFYPEEEKCSTTFSKNLASLAEVFVADSFGTAHRAHASTYGVAKYLPAYAGFLIQKEVETLGQLLEKCPHPMTLIVGGAKIDTKIGLIKNFVTKADYFLIGGGLANTFLAAEGYDVGKSLYEADKIEVAQETMLKAESFKENFILPEDAVVADEISEKAPTLDLPINDIEGEMKILDIGRKTIRNFIHIIEKSKIVVWNGPVGLFEMKPFGRGTRMLAKALANAKGVKTIIGGGDTIDAIKHFGYDEKNFTHVSTGGGAMLEFLEGEMLPGIEILLDKRIKKLSQKTKSKRKK